MTMQRHHRWLTKHAERPARCRRGLVLPPADFKKSGRPIPRPYWDAVWVYTFHCPLDLPVGDGTEFEWEDDPMPRYASYEQMIARDAAFAFWANEARQRFTNLSMHVRMMRNTPRDADEKIWQLADRAYALIAAQTGADLPDPDLSRLIDGDYDILHDDERCRIWWHRAEPHWAIKGYCPNATTTCLAQRATVRLARTPAVRRASAGGSIFDPQDRNSFIRSGAPQARMINR